MVIQYRGLTGRDLDRAYYSPERDIAYVGPRLITAAFAAMDEQWVEPWYRQFCQDQGVTEEKMAEAAVILARACNRIVQDENPVVALEAEGFHQLPGAIQMAIYTKMGQVLLAAVWGGVKDISTAGSDPPERMAHILEVAQTVLRHFAGRRGQDGDEEAGA